MKTDKYQKRFYREWVNAKGLFEARVVVQETDVHILTDKPIDKDFVDEKIRFYRRQIESYIQKDKRFLTSLKPITVELRAPAIVKAMNQAASKANVGPMAAVAGAIAEFLGRDLLKRGYKEVIIENGGDIFLKVLLPRAVGIYAGRVKLSGKLFLKINPKDSPLGICTSSGSVGHSLSFGNADSVIIIAKNAVLADAVATATANLVQSKKDLPKAIQIARAIKGVRGVVIILKNNLASWGKVEFK